MWVQAPERERGARALRGRGGSGAEAGRRPGRGAGAGANRPGRRPPARRRPGGRLPHQGPGTPPTLFFLFTRPHPPPSYATTSIDTPSPLLTNMVRVYMEVLPYQYVLHRYMRFLNTTKTSIDGKMYVNSLFMHFFTLLFCDRKNDILYSSYHKLLFSIIIKKVVIDICNFLCTLYTGVSASFRRL